LLHCFASFYGIVHARQGFTTMLSVVSSSGSESSCSSILALHLGLIPFFLGRLDDCRIWLFSPVGLLHRVLPVHPGQQ
jgi:hypothetical protein